MFKTFTKWIQVNVIDLMVWWKMHYSTIYCTQLLNFILLLIFNWFFSNAQFLFSTSIHCVSCREVKTFLLPPYMPATKTQIYHSMTFLYLTTGVEICLWHLFAHLSYFCWYLHTLFLSTTEKSNKIKGNHQKLVSVK